MSEVLREAWVVRLGVLPGALQKTLNALEQDNYQVFKVVLLDSSFVVIACDPALIGQRQGAAIAKSMGLLRDAVAASVAAGQAVLPPGVAP